MIRNARSYDATALAALSSELGYPATREQIGKRLAAIEAAGAAVLVAEDAQGMVCGWIHVACCAELTGQDSAEIHGLVVAAETRGAGLGRALIERASAWARERGCTQLRVRSRVEREDAHRFYLREGFTRCKTQAVFERALLDEVITSTAKPTLRSEALIGHGLRG